MDDRLRPGECVDAQGRVRVALPCAGCGYNLQHQTADHTCSECGAPISGSLQPELLVFASPRWIRRVLSGLLTIGASVPTVAVVFLLATWSEVEPNAGLGLFTLPLIVLAVGVFLASTPETQGDLIAAAIVARIAICAAVLSAIILALTFVSDPDATDTTLFGAVLISVTVAGACVLFGLSRIATRTRRRWLRLAMRLFAVAWPSVVGAAVTAACLGFYLSHLHFTQSRGQYPEPYAIPEWVWSLLSATLSVTWTLSLVASVLGLALLLWLHLRLHQTRRLAIRIRTALAAPEQNPER